MSDNSTGSSRSSSNTWTLLSPEESAIDSAGPVDDGTESIGDASGLSEEIAGSSLEIKPRESEAPHENVLLEDIHQMYQTASPEFFEGVASDITFAEDDPDICAPVIHDTITSSPPDNDLLGAVPFNIATESSLFLSEETILDQEMFPDAQPTLELPPKESPAAESKAEVTPVPEITEIRSSTENPDSPFSDITEVIHPISEISCTSVVREVDIQSNINNAPESSFPSQPDFGSVAKSALAEGPHPEVIAPSVLDEKTSAIQREEPELLDESVDVVREPETLGAQVSTDHPSKGDGLRLRHLQRQSSDEEEEEEEFKLLEKKEEKLGFSLKHFIIGALVLLCFGSLFYSEDFDVSELSDQELLEKLAQENKKILILEAQIQSQNEELDKALSIAADKGSSKKENVKLQEELSSLPTLKKELEELKARISELTQLTAEESSKTPFIPSSAGNSKDMQGPLGPNVLWDKQQELKRQKLLLEESRRRLEGIKKQGWSKTSLRESLVELQQRLSEQVDHMCKRDERKRKHKVHKKGKEEWEEKDKSNEWKMEEMEKKRKWKLDGGLKHKGHFKKCSEEWDHKKEQKSRKQESPWQTKLGHHHNQHHKQHQQQEPVDFWKHQEEKLRRNQNPTENCYSVSDCAHAEGLIPVKLSDFQTLLKIYLSKLEGDAEEKLEALRSVVAQFFHGGIFRHDRMLFSKFSEDVADVLEDLATVWKRRDSEALEEEMEQFEKEALWKFSAPGP